MERKSSWPGHALSVALVLVPAGAALALGLGSLRFVGWLAAVALAVGIGLVWLRRRRSLVVAIAIAVAGIIAPIFVAGFMADAVRLLMLPPAPISLGEIDRVATLDLVTLESVEVRAELRGEDLTPSSPNRPDYDFHAVPLVPPGWSRADEVRVWLVCKGDVDACKAVWAKRPVRGVVRRERAADDVAIQDAVQRHQLRTPPEVVTVTTPASARLEALAALVGIGLALLVLVVGAIQVSLRLERGAVAPGPSPSPPSAGGTDPP